MKKGLPLAVFGLIAIVFIQTLLWQPNQQVEPTAEPTSELPTATPEAASPDSPDGSGSVESQGEIGVTLLVNTTDDASDGACNATHCSLREAIIAANTTAALDTIAFNIGGTPPHVIRPSTLLP